MHRNINIGIMETIAPNKANQNRVLATLKVVSYGVLCDAFSNYVQIGERREYCMTSCIKAVKRGFSIIAT